MDMLCYMEFLNFKVLKVQFNVELKVSIPIVIFLRRGHVSEETRYKARAEGRAREEGGGGGESD
jgi:hypothetical protein